MESALLRTGILTGPTATGKTAIALAFARARPEIEIINADSMLVYRGMDIGTAKPSPAEQKEVPHHLIDVREPDQPYNAADFRQDVLGTIESLHARGKRALIVGGTGFYLKALLYGLWDAPKADPALRAGLEALPTEALHQELAARDPAAAARIGTGDRYRLVRAVEILRLSGKTPTELEAASSSAPDPRFALWIIDREPAELERRIAARTRLMLEQGLLDEVRAIHARHPGCRALDAVGYAETVAHLEGNLPKGRKVAPGLAGLASEIELGTRQLVKRQRTWFRGQTEGGWFMLDRDLPKLQAAMAEAYGT